MTRSIMPNHGKILAMNGLKCLVTFVKQWQQFAKKSSTDIPSPRFWSDGMHLPFLTVDAVSRLVGLIWYIFRSNVYKWQFLDMRREIIYSQSVQRLSLPPLFHETKTDVDVFFCYRFYFHRCKQPEKTYTALQFILD